MSDRSKIEWCDATWNVVTGCTQVSSGCAHCYAKTLHDRRHRAYQAGAKLPEQYAKPFSTIQLHPDRLEMPLHWKKPRRVFVNSMSDLFHEDVPDWFLAEVLVMISSCATHTFMVLTKRPERMLDYLSKWAEIEKGWITSSGPQPRRIYKPFWPIKNLWLGVSVEDQKAADERIPLLLQTPAAVRFVSCEPLLGTVDLNRTIWEGMGAYGYQSLTGLHFPFTLEPQYGPKLDWVITGGESGPNARLMHPDWARRLRDQCVAAEVPFFFKQWGEWAPDYLCDTKEPHKIIEWPHPGHIGCMFRCGKKAAGRMLDGREWNEFPAVER
ncbi:MAG TPA: hypothetical protein DCZ08_03600 [Anaerolineaceae bacterium]|nr:hypothetical protein [Anaerolineaceae bacterium]